MARGKGQGGFRDRGGNRDRAKTRGRINVRGRGRGRRGDWESGRDRDDGKV